MLYNILVVDDSAPMRAVIKKIIKTSGFMVKNFYDASNGLEAIECLKNNWMDVILTDFNMPDMNGMELVDALQNDEVLKSIPIVMITTEGSKKRIEEFMKRGVTSYIKKPFTPDQIKHHLSKIMGVPDYEERNTDESNEGLDF